MQTIHLLFNIINTYISVKNTSYILNMAFVSVIIPYFKKKTFIERTLLSVLNQTFQDFEIILIYDDEIK